jgi:hypothetical protein
VVALKLVIERRGADGWLVMFSTDGPLGEDESANR